MRLTRVTMVVAAATALLFAPATAAFAAPSDRDATYLKAAHQSNLAEIAGGKLAQSKAQNQKVKDLGARFVADHTKLDSALQKTAAELKVSLPSGPNAEQRALAARYQAASGSAFDALFISTQMDAHMKAMALGQTEISQGSDATVKTAAKDAAPIIASHHSALEAAARDLGVPDTISTGTGGLAARSAVSTWSVGMIVAGLLLVAGAVLWMRRRRSIVG